MPVTVEPLAPAEAIQFWKGKAPVSAKEFEAMDAAARTRAFAVSGLAKMDQVGSVHAAITKALDDGETLRDFKGRIGSIIEQQGWTGKKAWRVENIFRSNIQSAYMAGRHQQMKRVAKSRPYWQLVAVRDRRTRQTHLAVDGLVYPHDHPFWQTWYPPNGFACRCVVITLSERQVKARGLTVQTEIPDMIRVVDPETGMESFVTPIPDKGWATNVGEDWLAGLAPSEMSGMKDRDFPTLCRRGDFADDPCKLPISAIDPKHVHVVKDSDLLPKTGLATEEYVRAFLQEFGIGNLNGSRVVNVHGFPMTVSKWLFTEKATGEWKKTWTDKRPYMRLLARAILDPYEVWWRPMDHEATGRMYFTLRMIRLFRMPSTKEVCGFSSFSLFGRNWTGATAFAPRANRSQKTIYEQAEKERAGILIYRESLK
ncbi:MAG: phage minor head protein [Pseudodesulfovibrio sp.]|uniref:phage minor head protein n=1 Tax=Pseudodesulfovibrio sp. TaxID=2035812 RepID=UPI003D0CAFB8